MNIQMIACSLLLAACGAGPALVSSPEPGYDGGWPSAHGERAIDALIATSVIDQRGSFGGGVWSVERGAIIPHPVGPGSVRSGLRYAAAKGPHLVLTQRGCAHFLPTRSDGDVAAVMQLMGLPVVDGLLRDRRSDAFMRAQGRIAGLGASRDGLRVGVSAGEDEGEVLVQVWNVSDEWKLLRGDAWLQFAIGGRAPEFLDGPGLGGPAGPPQFDGFQLHFSSREVAGSPSEAPVELRLGPGQLWEKRVPFGALVVAGGLRQATKADIGGVVLRDFHVQAQFAPVASDARGGASASAPDGVAALYESEAPFLRLREALPGARR